MYTFTGYWKAESPNISGDWYITGDTMLRDEDGHLFFVGRNDDIITSAGYRIGPFDVESVVMEHPAVAEVAVIGKPDPQRTEIVKAVIVLKSGVEGTKNLKSEIQQTVRLCSNEHSGSNSQYFAERFLHLGSRRNCRVFGRMPHGQDHQRLL